MAAPPSYTTLPDPASCLRLLEFDHNGDPSEIHCRLRTVSLGPQAPPYTALSYVWGDPAVTETIFLDRSPVSVTINLASALRELRTTARSGEAAHRLWVDALCIDQANVHEKTHQVRAMHKIYQNAASVVAWLGREDEDVALAMETLELIGTCMLKDNDLTWMKKHPHLWATDTDRGHSQNKNWNAVARFFSNAYWTRGWTVQEMVFADRLVFQAGGRHLSWTHLREILRFRHLVFGRAGGLLNRPPASSIIPPEVESALLYLADNTIHLVNTCRWQIRNQVVTDPIGSTRRLRTSDPRDKIFAFYSLGASCIIPDYSLGVREVYCQYARHLVLSGNAESCFRYAGGPRSKFGLPSWVPDWQSLSDGGRESVTRLRFAGGFRVHNACERLPRVPITIQDNFTLAAKGIFCCSVTVARQTDGTHPHGTSGFSVDLSSFIETLTPTDGGSEADRCGIRFSESRTVAAMPILQFLLRTILKDTETLRPRRLYEDIHTTEAIASTFVLLLSLNEPHKRPSQLCVAETCRAFGHDPASTTLRGFLEHQFFPGMEGIFDKHFDEDGNATMYRGELSEVHAVISEVLSSSSALNNAQGWRGLGPRNLLPGDEIYIMSGCKFPVCLRKVEGGYHYVGPCFLLGAMNGEIAEILGENEIQWSQLVLL